MALTFDGVTKTITLSSGTTSINVKDVWSRWVDWFLTSDNSKFLPAFEQVGGNDIDISVGTTIPIYAFLMNGWKLQPQEADHTLSVTDGILVVNGGGDPFNDTVGAYTVRINYQQPVQAITVSTSGGSPWTEVIEGSFTASDLLKILVAVAAGKTTITDLGGGNATVVFRDLLDSLDRVEADMTGSERTNVTIN